MLDSESECSPDHDADMTCLKTIAAVFPDSKLSHPRLAPLLKSAQVSQCVLRTSSMIVWLLPVYKQSACPVQEMDAYAPEKEVHEYLRSR